MQLRGLMGLKTTIGFRFGRGLGSGGWEIEVVCATASVLGISAMLKTRLVAVYARAITIAPQPHMSINRRKNSTPILELFHQRAGRPSPNTNGRTVL